MSYKYSKGSQVIGDLKAADDAQRNTLIDFEEDQIDFQTSGSVRMTITNDNVEVATNLVPDTDASKDFGSMEKAWNNIFAATTYSETFAAPSDMTIDSGGDISLDADGGQIYMKDNNITYLTFNVNGTQDEISAVGNLKFVASGDLTLNAQGGDIFFQDNGTQRMHIEDSTGDVAIGSHSPTYRLDVRDNTSGFVMNIQQDSSLAGADMLRMDFSAETDPTGQIIYVYDQDNDRIYQVVGNGAGGSTVSTSFTAGHDTVIPQGANVVPGMIVETTGEIWYKPVNVTSETALPKCQLASSNGSKKVFGVIAGFPAPDEPKEEDLPYVHNGFVMSPSFPSYARKAGISSDEWNIATMSIGEGVVWVSNINGEIENGDLIESSIIPGYGRKQDDDIMRSKTVAKCTEQINWDLVTETIENNGVNYKIYLSSCTFHCG